MLIPEEVETILAIARFGGLAQAADHLHSSQSTVTYRLQSLERKWGHTLVRRGRGSRSTELTPAGEQFLAVAERWEDLVQEALRIRMHENIAVRVGASDVITSNLLDRFHRYLTDSPLHPHISTEAGSGPWICNQIALQYLDMGFVFFDRVHSDLLSAPVAKCEMVLLRSSDCSEPADDGTPLSIEQLPRGREIRVPWGPDFDAWLQRHLGSSPMAEVSKTYALPPFLRARDTWTIASAFMAENMAKLTDCTIHPLTDEAPDRTIYKVTNRRVGTSNSQALVLLEDAWKSTVEDLRSTGAQLTWI